MIPKYKAYDLVENEWISIRTIGLGDNGEFWYLQAWDECENDIDPPYFEDDLGVKWELLQTTGLKDKNGAEIFEGDIVKTKYGEHGRHIGVVKYGGTKFYSEGVKQYLSWHEDLNGLFEIIGNEFEHKELLEGDNE